MSKLGAVAMTEGLVVATMIDVSGCSAKTLLVAVSNAVIVMSLSI